MNRSARSLAILVAAAAAFLLAWYWPQVRNEIFVIVGNRDEAGGWYGTWSGFGGALQIFCLLASAGLIYWHHTCHDHPLCLRWGKYEAAGGVFKVCRHHHPDMQGHTGTHRELIHRMNREWKERTA